MNLIHCLIFYIGCWTCLRWAYLFLLSQYDKMAASSKGIDR